MRRTLLVSTPVLGLLLISGCWVTWESECDFPFGDCEVSASGGALPCDDPFGCDGLDVDVDGSAGAAGAMFCVPGSTRYCDTPTYCSWGEQRCNDRGDGWSQCYEGGAPLGCGGYAFDEDCCLEAGGCCQDWYDYDGDGDYDDSVGNCPEVPTCGADEECPEGYCSAAEGEIGQCIATGICSGDEDCAAFGPGLGCDDRGLCAPEQEPCPSGECGCSSDEECSDGMLCLGSRCADPAAVCFFDFECGDSASCLDNECHATCATDLCCPTGQACASGICVSPATGADGCVFNEDCGVAGGFECINGTCHAACALVEDCGPAETCLGGVCRASTTPSHECLDDAGCDSDMTCHRGLCRLPCAASINCGGEMTLCGDDGFCIAPSEVAPECIRASDCGDSEVCLDNACTTLVQ